VEGLPGLAVAVVLLDGGPVGVGLEPHRVDEPLREGAAVRPPHRMRQRRQRRLVLRLEVEQLTLLQVLPLQRPPNDVDLFFLLGNPEVNSVVHHFAKLLEFLAGDVEKKDLRTRNVLGPIKLVRLVTSYYQYVVLVYHHYLPFTDLLVVDLEACPL